MCAEDTEETQPGLVLLFIDQVTKHVNSETVDDLKIGEGKVRTLSEAESSNLQL